MTKTFCDKCTKEIVARNARVILNGFCLEFKGDMHKDGTWGHKPDLCIDCIRTIVNEGSL